MIWDCEDFNHCSDDELRQFKRLFLALTVANAFYITSLIFALCSSRDLQLWSSDILIIPDILMLCATFWLCFFSDISTEVSRVAGALCLLEVLSLILNCARLYNSEFGVFILLLTESQGRWIVFIYAIFLIKLMVTALCLCFLSLEIEKLMTKILFFFLIVIVIAIFPCLRPDVDPVIPQMLMIVYWVIASIGTGVLYLGAAYPSKADE